MCENVSVLEGVGKIGDRRRNPYVSDDLLLATLIAESGSEVLPQVLFHSPPLGQHLLRSVVDFFSQAEARAVWEKVSQGCGDCLKRLDLLSS